MEVLFQSWGCRGISVEVVDFSFVLGDVDQMMQLLDRADIFVMIEQKSIRTRIRPAPPAASSDAAVGQLSRGQTHDVELYGS